MMPLPTWIPRPEEIDAKACAAAVREGRSAMTRDAAAVRDAMKCFVAFDSQLLEVEQAQAVSGVSLRLKPDAFGVSLATPVERREVAAAARVGRQQLEKLFDPFETAASRRMAAALALLEVPQVAERVAPSAANRAEIQRLLSVAGLLRGLLDQILAIRNANAALGILARQIAGNQKNVVLFRGIRERMQHQLMQIGSLSEKLALHRYPFDHAKGDVLWRSTRWRSCPLARTWAAF